MKNVPWGKLAISTIVIAGFFACMIVLLTFKVEFGTSAEKAFLILVGVLGSSFGQVINYWFGSSAGSAQKSDQLAAMAATNGTPR